MMRIKKNINLGILVDPILNSLNEHYKNCMVESKENYKFDLGVLVLKYGRRNDTLLLGLHYFPFWVQ